MAGCWFVHFIHNLTFNLISDNIFLDILVTDLFILQRNSWQNANKQDTFFHFFTFFRVHFSQIIRKYKRFMSCESQPVIAWNSHCISNDDWKYTHTFAIIHSINKSHVWLKYFFFSIHEIFVKLNKCNNTNGLDYNNYSDH